MTMVPGCQKSAASGSGTSSSAPFRGPVRTARVHLDFSARQPFACVCCDIGDQRSAVFTFSHPHLRPGVVTVMDGFLLALKTQAGKGVWPRWEGPVRGPVRSHNCWSGRAEILHRCRIGSWKCFIVCFCCIFPITEGTAESMRVAMRPRDG